MSQHVVPTGRQAILAALLVAMVGGTQAATLIRTSAFDYDAASGQLTKEIVEPGDSTLCLVTTYGYDAWGHKNGSTTRNCNGSAGSSPAHNSEAAAPAAGNAALFTTRSSGVTYSTDGRFPVTSTNALGQTETKTYNATLGVLTQLTGPNGLSTQWKYDEWGRKVLEKRADGNGTSIKYEYCSSVIVNGVAGPASCPTIAGAVGTYVITSTPVKAPIDIAAGTHGGANGPYSKAYYDTLGRTIRSETQAWDGSTERILYQDTEYNHLGQVVRSSQPYFAGTAAIWVVTGYDWLGRAKVVTQPDGSKSTSTYAGLTITVTDDLGRATVQTRNVADQLVQITDPNGKILRKTYDPYGNLLTTTDSLGNVTQLRYDARGRKDRMIDPDMGTWTYGYNALGELKQQTDAKAQVTTMSYDLLGRLTAKTEPSLNTNWYYDRYQDNSACNKGIGKLCEARASNGYVRKHDYDNFGRASSSATTIGATTYTGSVTYTADGRTDTVTYPGAALTLKNQYTTLGYLQQVVNAANTATVYWRATGIDALGHITTQVYGNGVTTTGTFDPLTGRLRQTVAGTGNAVQNVSYTYDTIGNLKTRNDALTGVNASYGYDNLNRMLTETRQGGGVGSAQTITWVYDDLGNITSRSDVGTYAYNASGPSSVRPHAVTSVTGSVNGQVSPSYNYDANGNLQTVTVAGATLRSTTWNSYNKVDSITRTQGGASNRLDFLYDSEGDRVREVFSVNGATQRTTVYLGSYEEETSGGVTKKKHYIGGAGGTIGVLTLTGSTWSTQYWHKDHLGSPMVITEGAGAVTERLAYEPFGKRRNANGTTDANGALTATSTRRGFTGHEHDDEVGLINMNGRIYDQAIGRFLSADPTLQAPNYMQSYNRYAYMWNSPLNGTDPSGYSNVFADYDRLKNYVVAASFGPLLYKPVYQALTGKYGYQIKSVAISYGATWCGAWASLCAGAGQAGLAKAYGASNKDAAKAGAIAAAMVQGNKYIGDATSNTTTYSESGGGSVTFTDSMTAGQMLANTAGHAALGCASASASGGSCRSGALAGGFSAAWTNYGTGATGNLTFDLMQNMVVGGIGAELGGGQFANGAVTGAFGYLYNCAAHQCWGWANAQRSFVQAWKRVFVDPFQPDYIAGSTSVLSAQGGGAVNLRDGTTFAAGGVAMTDPAGTQWRPGLSGSVGYIWGASNAAAVNSFLGGSGNQAFLSVPTGTPVNLFFAVTHSFGGSTALEVGIASPGKLTGGVSPFSHATKIGE
jgi:RHS repeat-associated protein